MFNHPGAAIKFSKRFLFLLLSLWLFDYGLVNAQNITINEVMGSNSSVIADEDGDFPDWIELFNPAFHSINLSGYALSDEAWNPYKWTFPDTVIEAQSFIIIFASGKDRTVPGHELHTNFRINKSLDIVMLTDSFGTVLDNVLIEDLPTDISYGQYPDGSGEWFYYSEPTPGFSNGNEFYSEILQKPVFSHNGGYYDYEFNLGIFSADPEAIIIYTLDGSEPDINNIDGTTYIYKKTYPQNPGSPFGDTLVGSFITYFYNDDVLISDISHLPDSITQIGTAFYENPVYFPESPVEKGIIVRTAAFKEGAMQSEINSATFFVGQNNETDLPVISISISEDNLFDYYDGIYVPGVEFDQWRLSNPFLPAQGNRPANYHRRGEEWEFPAHLEIFETSGTRPDHAQNVGLRIHGGFTRAYPCKSLRIYFRSRYGQSELNYPIFRDTTYNNYKRLILRNSGNDWRSTMMRDGLMHSIVKHLNIETSEYRPAILFINGEYWGIHNIRERYDKHYLNRVFGVNPENIDFLYDNQNVKYGDNENYQNLLSFIGNNDLEIHENYDYVQTRMDIENFIDYQISNIFFNNTDWPRTNIDYWRLRTQYDSLSEYGHDGRWRWMLYDTDFGFGLFDGSYLHNTLEYASQWSGFSWQNPLWSTFLLRNLFLNQNFVNKFVTRFADLLNSSFRSQHVIALIEELSAKIEPEMESHIHRWSYPSDMNEWHDNLDVLQEFAQNRPYHQLEHIKEKFENINQEFTITLDVSDNSHGYIRINTIEIHENTPGIPQDTYPWQGIYFMEVPIEIHAIPKPGYQFVEWRGDTVGISAGKALLSNLFFEADVMLKAVFEPEEKREVLHYWHFNNLSEGIHDHIPADESFYIQKAVLSYPGTQNAYMDRVSDGTQINATENTQAGYALRVRNPAKEHILLFESSTKGFENIKFSFANKRTTNGAQVIAVYYSVDPTENLIHKKTIFPSDKYKKVSVDLSHIEQVNDNEHFKIKLFFSGSNANNEDGNNRFDNIMICGTPLPGTNMPPVVTDHIKLIELIENSSEYTVDLNDFFEDPDNDSLTYSVEKTNELSLELQQSENILEIIPLQRGGSKIIIFADDGHNPIVKSEFRVLVYPGAYELEQNPDFIFDYWSSDNQEHHYPENMLFLQSDKEDPDLNYELLFAYYIPEQEYEGIDTITIGFPYNNSQNTRINGLEDKGVSFVNTGTNRDLGGLVLALNTQGMQNAFVSWVNETLFMHQRYYGMRLLYRTGIDEEFIPMIIEGQPADYIPQIHGQYKEFISIQLPENLLEQEYVQLLWRYFPLSSSGERRTEIRIDNINITRYPLSVPEIIIDTKISIYPNPVKDQLFVETNLPVSMTIYNSTGKQIFVTNETKIDFSQLPPGVYCLVLNFHNYQIIKTKTIIKTN